MARVRSTSLQVYREIRDNGLLSDRRMMVYRAVFKLQPTSAGVIARKTGYVRNAVCSRLGELKELGVIGELPDPGVCPYTGHSVLLWVTTDRLPVEQDSEGGRQQTRKELIAKVCELEAENTKLRARVDRLRDRISELKGKPKKKRKRLRNSDQIELPL